MNNTRSKSNANAAKPNPLSPVPSSPMTCTFAFQSPKTPNSDRFIFPLSLYPTPKSLSGSPTLGRGQTEPEPEPEAAPELVFERVMECATEDKHESALGSSTAPESQPKTKPRRKAKAQPKGKAQSAKDKSSIKATPRPKASPQSGGKSQNRQFKAAPQHKSVSRKSRKSTKSPATEDDENAAKGNGYTLLDVLAASQIVNDTRGSDSNLFGLLLLSVISELQPSWTSGNVIALEP
ncbi:hypothetical protein I308_104597 [Cryptococcus tetragattii IND107]|uniref:Uncharacterized protein n=1 Tax=Cryptococcus tetragattii IND107 TaxID=1296105 RepID=A0ABR3BN22_9TREE|nr:hypothetical protein I308_01186 [Cryptococcus tetragattii IND107]